ncbi:MAG: hypothetical protein KGI04_03895 [Candidatus Micrarchaeota archaeon]|nr:hypothetical protein [Candidatus Micrarchaeota archaeon]
MLRCLARENGEDAIISKFLTRAEAQEFDDWARYRTQTAKVDTVDKKLLELFKKAKRREYAYRYKNR